MSTSPNIVLHPITITTRPYPSWDRVRIALECLLMGTVTYRGEIIDISAERRTSQQDCPDKQPSRRP